MPDRLIKQLVIIFTVLIVLWILFRITANRKEERFSRRFELILFVFFIYLLSVMFITVIPLPGTSFKKPVMGGINVIPFKNIINGIVNLLFPKKTTETENISENLFGNVLIFIPFGMLLPFFSGTFRSLKRVTLFALFCSTLIELTQLTLRLIEVYRFVDVDDIILNTLGAALGFIFINKIFFKRKRKQRRIKFR